MKDIYPPLTETEKDANAAFGLADKIKPMLAGKDPGVQGGALVELVATWLAGHNPLLRDEVWKHWCEATKDMVPLCEKEILSHYPNGWEKH